MNYKFTPKDNITVKELADIVAGLEIFVPQEWLDIKCPDELKRHWEEADQEFKGVPHEHN